MAGFYYAGQSYPGQSGILVGEALLLPHIASTTQMYAPSVQQVQIIGLAHIASTTVLYPPTVASVQILLLPHIASVTDLFPPIVTPVQILSLPHIDSTTLLYAPTVSQNISLPHIDSTTQLFTPTVIPVQILELPHIDSVTQLFPPTLAPTQLILLPHIDSTTILYAPTITIVGDEIRLPHIGSRTRLFGFYANNSGIPDPAPTPPTNPLTPDLTKLVFHSAYPAFKNNTVYTGSFSISGTTSGGVNTRTATINLSQAPDLADIVFSGRSTQTYTNRPNNAWFKRGIVEVRGDGGSFTNYQTPWVITARIVGSQIIITATSVQTFTTVLTLTASTVNYRVVDYSVF